MNAKRIPAPKNDPRLMQLILVKVLRPFCVAGQPLALGDEVAIEFHLARDLVAIGKVRIIAPVEDTNGTAVV